MTHPSVALRHISDEPNPADVSRRAPMERKNWILIAVLVTAFILPLSITAFNATLPPVR